MMGVIQGFSSLNGVVTGGGGGGGTSTQFVTSGAPAAALKNDFTGYIGFEFTPASNVTITALRAWIVSGNTAKRIMKVCLMDGTIIASALMDTSVKTGGAFASVDINPLTLASGTSYAFLYQVTLGGDLWYSFAPITHTAIGTVGAALYQTIGGSIAIGGSGEQAYGPLSFDYNGLTPSATLPVQLTGTPFSSTPYDTPYAAQYAFDGDTGTMFASLDANNAWLGLDLGAAHNLIKISLWARNTFESRLQDLIIEGSNTSDTTGYTTISTTDYSPGSSYTDYPAFGSYRWVRIYRGSTGNNLDCMEMRVYGSS